MKQAARKNALKRLAILALTLGTSTIGHAALDTAVATAAVTTAAVELPNVQPPAGFETEESSPPSLTRQQLKDLKPWAENSEAQLKDLLNQIQGMDPVQTRATLVQSLGSVLTSSGSKRTEILMRSVIERALKIYAILSSQDHSAQALYAENSILKQSAERAMEYYQSDVRYLQGSPTPAQEIPYAQYGRDYAHFLMEVDQGILNAQAQYGMAVLAMQLLEWDLYRDAKLHYDLAPQIVKIDRFLKSLPAQTGNDDATVVGALRRIRKVYHEVSSELSSLKGAKLLQKTDTCSPANIAQGSSGYECVAGMTTWSIESEMVQGKQVFLDKANGMKVTDFLEGPGSYSEATTRCSGAFRLPTRAELNTLTEHGIAQLQMPISRLSTVWTNPPDTSNTIGFVFCVSGK